MFKSVAGSWQKAARDSTCMQEISRDICHKTKFLRCLSIRRKRQLNFGHLMEQLSCLWECTTTVAIALWPKRLDIQPGECRTHCKEGPNNGTSGRHLLRVHPYSAREEGRIFPPSNISVFSPPLPCTASLAPPSEPPAAFLDHAVPSCFSAFLFLGLIHLRKPLL